MKRTYIVEVESVISRPITVEACDQEEASWRARSEFARGQGVSILGCAAVDIYETPEEFGITYEECE
tara:strand:- start:3906 stop:4106 length:201 start_codon:yes stop_codon:yes gene_type:complete